MFIPVCFHCLGVNAHSLEFLIKQGNRLMLKNAVYRYSGACAQSRRNTITDQTSTIEPWFCYGDDNKNRSVYCFVLTAESESPHVLSRITESLLNIMNVSKSSVLTSASPAFLVPVWWIRISECN